MSEQNKLDPLAMNLGSFSKTPNFVDKIFPIRASESDDRRWDRNIAALGKQISAKEDALASAIARIVQLEAEVGRWKANSIAKGEAFAAMRNSINEFVPMQSEQADLAQGPELHHECETIATAVIIHLNAKDARIAELESTIRNCQWYWPGSDLGEHRCEYSEFDVVNTEYEYSDSGDKNGSVVEVVRGGTIETTFCAMLPPAPDSDSDDEFWVQEPTRELAEAKIAAEILRREELEDKTP